jgi:uncharacterized membrane protein
VVKLTGTAATIAMLLGAGVAAGTWVFSGGWWLDAAERVYMTLTLLTITTFTAIVFWRSTSPRDLALTVWVGFVIASATILMAIGPGTIFPIVIIVGAVMSGFAIAVGAGAGVFVRVVTRRFTRSDGGR